MSRQKRSFVLCSYCRTEQRNAPYVSSRVGAGNAKRYVAPKSCTQWATSLTFRANRRSPFIVQCENCVAQQPPAASLVLLESDESSSLLP